jgi:class 3 adenylate cyclase
VVDAVRFAVEVQTVMIERNAGVPEDTRIQFRVGIHLGDVVEESDGDLMGDGVNPRPGWSAFASVCLSEQAYWLAADTSGGASTNPASCADTAFLASSSHRLTTR